jgi:hypothetical protein
MKPPSMFPANYFPTKIDQKMNYIGSKHKLSAFIVKAVGGADKR